MVREIKRKNQPIRKLHEPQETNERSPEPYRSLKEDAQKEREGSYAPPAR
jgi:hypothetical protein